MTQDEKELLLIKNQLLGSLLRFIRIFYKLRTGREFELSHPVGRESHFLTICRELTDVFYLRTNRLVINVPPGHGKTEMIVHFVAWAMAHYPDCQFMYISCSHELATKATTFIKDIMTLPHYKKLFGIEIDRTVASKDHFRTTAGGVVAAFGSQGTIVGQNAGLPNMTRFSGGVVIDDFHKPHEVHSETIREREKTNYGTTIEPRPRGKNVPIIGIGQRLHEDDIWGDLIKGMDGRTWKKVVLKGLDDNGNPLYPENFPLEDLLRLRENRPYVFASQQQQDPLPAGGGLFRIEDFTLLNEEPEMLMTFITVDTGETEKTYNDPTVFSLWGVYKVTQFGHDMDLYNLHWIDCKQLWCEPADLEDEFNLFLAESMLHPVKPSAVAIEKKSTGVTLSSLLKKKPGIQVIDVIRTKASGSKTERFLEMQPIIRSRRITLTEGNAHVHMCVSHMKAITANNTHAHDDICDTAYDAVKMALIDQNLSHFFKSNNSPDLVVSKLGNAIMKRNIIRKRSHAWPI